MSEALGLIVGVAFGVLAVGALSALALRQQKARLDATFRSLSADVLRTTSEDFLRLASTKLEAAQAQADGRLAEREQALAGLLQPMKDTLTKYEEQLRALEGKREGAYAAIQEHLRALGEAQVRLQAETTTLSTALRHPQVRGRWGELSLQRVVELAGLQERCDFAAQVTIGEDGHRQRPDLVVHLPAGRSVAVDSKVPLAAYLDYVQAADDAQRQACLEAHADAVAAHLKQLASKAYWTQLAASPEFVVMFLPGEPFLAAALQVRPELLEEGAEEGVILATPTTLISLLKSVAMGWREERLAENAQAVSDLGEELYDRLLTMTGHLDALGKSLGKSVDAYNKTVGSFEGRVLVGARKFRDLGAAGEQEIPLLEPVEKAPRAPSLG